MAAAAAERFLADVESGRLPPELLPDAINEAARAATALVGRADGPHDPASLTAVVQLWRRIVSACPASHPNRTAMLTNLGVALRDLAARTDSVEAIDEMISILEQVLALTADDSPARAMRLINLGSALQMRFVRTEVDEDLRRALPYLQHASELMAPDDPERPELWTLIGATYRMLAARTPRSRLLGDIEAMMSRRHEAVYAVSALLHARSTDAAAEIFRAEPALRHPDALLVLSALIEDAKALGDDSPLSIRMLEAHRGLVSRLQPDGTTETPDRRDPVSMPDSLPVTAPPWLDEARALLADGRVEPAEALLTGAAATARANGNALDEGHAEYALHELVFTTIWPAPGSVQRMAVHASSAENAYRRAGDERGLAASLRRQVAIAIDRRNDGMLNDVLPRLLILDPSGGVWWHTYIKAVTGDDPQYSRAQLEWCIERTARLGTDAAHFRAVCESKLALLDGRLSSTAAGLPGELGTLLGAVERHGPTPELAGRLQAALEPVERMRSHALSRTVQRGLSAVYTPVYEALSRCVAITSPEAGVDVLERNTSRALPARPAGRPGRPESDDTRLLDGLVENYLRQPTPQHRHLLTLGFDRVRQAERFAERRMLSAVSGPARTPAPATVRQVRDILEGDAVLFFAAPGDIHLISRQSCEVVGAFSPDDGTLAQPIVPALAGRVAPGSRLFLVPYGATWRTPVGTLGTPSLADVYRVATVPSLSVLMGLLEAAPRIGPPGRLAGLADPDGSLPFARTEIDAVAACYPEASTRVGADASLDAYRADAAGADIVHLACHGFYLPDYPDFAGLRLSGADGGAGMLWYSDIAGTPTDASLVVLAACHAGTGEVLSGSDYVGVPGALLAAGARTVLAPLWPVDDEVTAGLMEHFHAAYVATGSAALALRQAQAPSFDLDASERRRRSVSAFQLIGLP